VRGAVSFSDEELEEIKRRRLAELQKQLESAKQQEAQRAAEEARRQEILRRILTPEARARLSNLKLVKPEIVEALENQLISLAASGSVRVPIDDETLKQILARLSSRTTDIKLRVSFT
jgi:programmed cell death protein 5